MFRKKTAYQEESVLQGLRQGGPAGRRAANVLFDRFAYLVAKGRTRHGLSEEEALDAYTEAILALIQQVEAGRFREENRVSTLLHQIFYHKCVDVFRKRTNTKVMELEDSTLARLPDRAQDILRRLMAQEAAAEVAACMSQLGDSCREVLWDALYHGYSPAEIAEKMGFKNAETAMSQKSRCLKKLKELIARKKESR